MARIVFFGTPAFALPALDALHRDGHDLLVITKPDAPVGRGRRLTPSPVKQRATELALPVLTPERLDAAATTQLQAWRPTCGVLAAYGKLLPPAVLAAFPSGILNIHPSLLPRHRGASPVAATILAGDTATGVSIMLLDAGMDTGPVLAQETVSLHGNETTGELETTLAQLGANVLCRVLPAYLRGELLPKPQQGAASTTTLLKKHDAMIDWSRPAAEVDRQIRAMTPAPGAFTFADGQRLKILHAVPSQGASTLPPGTLVNDAAALDVACGDGRCITLLRVRPENGNAMDARSFRSGHPALTALG